VNPNERRTEILKVLVARRSEKICNLAFQLGVSIRTIKYDIEMLTAEYPLETVRGHGGCVKVADWYHPHKNIFSREQQDALMRMLDKADEPDQRILREMLAEMGSPKLRELLSEERKSL
jgi:predicted DNA-binding transcriptional regulator YafY